MNLNNFSDLKGVKAILSDEDIADVVKLASVLKLGQKTTEELVSLAYKQPHGVADLIPSIFSVVLAVAAADGKISSSEKKEIFDPLFSSVERHLKDECFHQISAMLERIPNVKDCVTYIGKLGKNINYEIFDAIIEMVAKSDDKFCFKEKEFLDNFRIKTNRTQAVPVVATMSSGKSTLINAMLRSDLLPSENQACTATVLKVENYDGIVTPYARSTRLAEGVSDWQPVSAQKLKEWNSQGVAEVEILGNFSKIDFKKAHMVLYDTPGPNNAMDKSHAEITNSILEQAQYGQVVVVLNAEQFGINDELNFLDRLKFVASSKSEHVRFLFVLNKFDCLDLDDESSLQFILKVRKMLNEVDLKRPVLIPTMSRLALDIRTVLDVSPTTGLTWTNRRQKKLLRDIEYLEENSAHYQEAISHTKTNQKLYLNAKQNAFVEMSGDSIELGDQLIPRNRLLEADLLTGIPILEAALSQSK
ncbi:dynamin family protein [Maridesulfovibrio ferrireducens]|uniref:dynamin family protein n=1 Tax=Maridesulfovibrio ferrireducens TaxID=246191 RepID=UPI001A1D9CDF|nr:dynamin family protein [Maridesulfovibrio ferrireducens]MBI9109961.1 dynamin family protein [Maridesulfovibrio ferrireducens]